MTKIPGPDGEFVFAPLNKAVDDWRVGGLVWSAELGGIGPGYEQVIQVLLWEILSEWGDKKLPPQRGKDYPKQFLKFTDAVVSKLSKQYGFSGAQVGAARATAWQFLKYGYPEMMERIEKDRRIIVSKDFPRPPK